MQTTEVTVRHLLSVVLLSSFLLASSGVSANDCRSRLSIELSDLNMGTYEQPKVNKIPLNSDAQTTVTFGNRSGTHVQGVLDAQTDKVTGYDVWLDRFKPNLEHRKKLFQADQISVNLNNACEVTKYTSVSYAESANEPHASKLNYIINPDFCTQFLSVSTKSKKTFADEVIAYLSEGGSLSNKRVTISSTFRQLANSTKAEIPDLSLSNLQNINSVCSSPKYSLNKGMPVVNTKIKAKPSTFRITK